MTIVANQSSDQAGSLPVLRALIAEDEPAARRRLLSHLGTMPDIEVIAECGDGDQAREKIRGLRPDIALLDIEMPGFGGLELARQLATPPEGGPVVILFSAVEQHALGAFEAQAADYLVKPFTRERLRQALLRARALCRLVPEDGVHAQPSAKPVAPLNRLIVPTGERMLVVPAPQIDWIESAGNYAVIHVGNDTHVLRETLLELETRLPAGHFLRISRTTIVNLDRVRELRSDSANGHVMLLSGGAKLAITKGIREVQKRLESC